MGGRKQSALEINDKPRVTLSIRRTLRRIVPRVRVTHNQLRRALRHVHLASGRPAGHVRRFCGEVN
eukprot:4951764-Prymnesium_polylepis.1